MPLRLAPDARLVRRTSAGERDAFAEIYRRYHDAIYRYCTSMLLDQADAQDAMQASMASALAALDGETRPVQLRPWLYRIAHNECISAIRRRRDHATLDAAAELPAPGIEATVEVRARLRELVADLGTLSERQRSALVMRELGDLGYDEIADAMGTSAAGAKQSVYEARMHLQQLEEGRAVGCDAIRRTLSTGDGRSRRARRVRAHLRACSDCRAFGDLIAGRRADLAALAPPIAAPSAAAVLAALIDDASAASVMAPTAAGGGATSLAAPVAAAGSGTVAGAIGSGAAATVFAVTAKGAIAAAAAIGLAGGGYAVLRSDAARTGASSHSTPVARGSVPPGVHRPSEAGGVAPATRSTPPGRPDPATAGSSPTSPGRGATGSSGRTGNATVSDAGAVEGGRSGTRSSPRVRSGGQVRRGADRGPSRPPSGDAGNLAAGERRASRPQSQGTGSRPAGAAPVKSSPGTDLRRPASAAELPSAPAPDTVGPAPGGVHTAPAVPAQGPATPAGRDDAAGTARPSPSTAPAGGATQGAG